MKKLTLALVLVLAVASAHAFFPFGTYGSPYNQGAFPAWGDMFGFNDIDATFRTRNYGRGYGNADPYYNQSYFPGYGYGAPMAPYYGAPVAPMAPPAAPAAQ